MIKVIFVFVVVGCISFSDACSCLRTTDEQQYCGSNFAGLIYVLNSGIVFGGKRTYNILVLGQIKGVQINPTKLITATNSAACGVSLTAGNVYFVTTGSSSPLSLNLCQRYQNWSSLTLVQVAQKLQAYQMIDCTTIPPIGTPIEKQIEIPIERAIVS